MYWGGGRGVPGVVGTGYWVGGWEGLYPVPTQYTLPDPYLVIFQASSPTHGPMKAILSEMMRFPEIGSRIDLN